MPSSTGHKEEFENLFKSNYSKLYYYALNILHDSESAKDIVSDVFLHVWENSRLNNGSLLLTRIPVLYTMVRNNCIDKIRHLDVHQKYEESVIKDSIPLIDDSEYKERDERMESVIKSISGLPPQTQIAFKKCFIEGKKYKEVSDEMNISVNTVKTYIVKALKIIREENGMR